MAKIYAHRGYSGRYPENTMLAFRKAAETGCEGIELDVQLTKDGQLVVIHDERIDRTTDGHGFVKDYSLEELRKFNAAAVWNGKYGFEPIPSFEEYCQWAKEQDLLTNIELKTGVYYYEEIEKKVVEMVKKYNLEDKVLFSSFNHSSLTELRKLMPERKCGALVEHVGLGNAGYYCSKFDFQCYHPGWEGLTEEEVKGCRDRGIEVNVWTVNDMGVLERLLDWNCDGIITNYPDVCKAYVDSRKKADR